jgi:hypothetical protein
MSKLIRLSAIATLLCFTTVAAFAQNGNAQQAAPAAPTIAPSPSLVKDGKCYELRTYYAAPGKLEELHKRFRNHTMKLFKKNGMTVVGFWGPTDKEKGSENTLVYLLAFPSREARDKAWKEFVADPDWLKVRDESQKNGLLLDKIESMILGATDYAPVK